MNAIDALAISMLTAVMTSFGVITLLFINMARSGAKRDPELEKLIQEASSDSANLARNHETQTDETAPWERKPDWWKYRQ